MWIPHYEFIRPRIRDVYQVESKDSIKAEHINKTLWEMGDALAII